MTIGFTDFRPFNDHRAAVEFGHAARRHWPGPHNLVLHWIHAYESRRSALQLVQDENIAFVIEKVETFDEVLTRTLEIEKMSQRFPRDFPHSIAPDPEFSLRRLKHKEPGRRTDALDSREFLGNGRRSQRCRRQNHHAHTHCQKFRHDLLLWRGGEM